jgi:DNA helicase-2/ATP-dependent DNA helicase PcrA
MEFPSAPRYSAATEMILQSLNPSQKEAVLATDGPLIVLAGAGSGKTKMLTSRIAYLIEAQRVPPSRILAVTFTNKAAHEMKERVSRMLSGSSALGVPEIGTFHSVAVRILRRELPLTPFTKPFVIYDDSDQLSLIKTVLGKLGIDEKQMNPKSVRSAMDRLKCDAVEPHELVPSPHNLFEKQLKRIYEEYQKQLFASNALDFGEILCMAYRILRDNPATRAAYQQRFRYLHVDEYQDTNRAQYLLLAELAHPRRGGHGNLCVVGDEDQSIYKWRGADIRNILDFEKDYPGASVVKLEQNYRSTATIIRAAGEVIRNNTERKNKTLWTENPEGEPVQLAALPDERAEAEFVISEIKRLAVQGDRSYEEFAVFYRTHAQSRQFEDVLRREKIAYQIVGGLRFYDRKEIKDVLSYFKAILNSQDSVSLKRILNVPARGIGKTTVEKLEELQNLRNISFWEILLLAAEDSTLTSSGASRKIRAFVELMKRLMEAAPLRQLSELYHLLLDEIGYVRELRQEGTDEALARIENLEEFDTLLQEFEEGFFQGGVSGQEGFPLDEESRKARYPELLPLFLEQSSLQSEADRTAEAGGALPSVSMMSLHSSKGLEFPFVFLVGMEEGLFPSLRPWEETDSAEIEEERRLCYVGMTRARERLTLTHVSVRRLWGNVTYQEPARFLSEIPRECLRQVGLGGGRGESLHSHFGRSWGGLREREDRSEEEDLFESSPVLIGRKIQHPEYGLGTVLSVEGQADLAKVQVEFRGRDRRKFLWRFVQSFLID